MNVLNLISITNNLTNCYLIQTNDGWLLIDTGSPDTFSQLLQLLYQNEISVNEINYLLVTHFHPDHAGLTQTLRDLGTNLIVHENQIPYMHKLNTFFKKNPKANFKDIIPNNVIVLSDSNSRSFLESLDIHGNLIPTPGHSDDSVSLVIDDECAFTGDLPSFHLKDAYNDLVIEDSWNMILNYNIKTIYPSHGEIYELDNTPI